MLLRSVSSNPACDRPRPLPTLFCPSSDVKLPSTSCTDHDPYAAFQLQASAAPHSYGHRGLASTRSHAQDQRSVHKTITEDARRGNKNGQMDEQCDGCVNMVKRSCQVSVSRLHNTAVKVGSVQVRPDFCTLAATERPTKIYIVARRSTQDFLELLARVHQCCYLNREVGRLMFSFASSLSQQQLRQVSMYIFSSSGDQEYTTQ